MIKRGLFSAILFLFFSIHAFAENSADAVLADSTFKAARQEMLKQNYTEAVKLLHNVDERYPNHPTVLDHMAYSYLKLDMNDDAIFTYKNALRAGEKTWGMPQKDTAKMYANLGLAYLQSDRTDAALWAYRKAVETTPDYAKAWQSLGQIYAKLGQEDKAVEAYQRSLKLDSKVFQSWMYLANIYVKKGETKLAIEAYQKSTQLNPQSAEAWKGLGELYLKLKQTQKANDAFAHASKLAPQKFSVYGDKKLEEKESPQILPYLKALELNPDNVSSWQNLGQAYMRDRRPDRAIPVYARALWIWGGDLEDDENEKLVKNKEIIFKLLYEIGQAYYMNQNYKESIDSWKRSINILTSGKKNKDDTDFGTQDRTWYKIGCAYTQLKKYYDAIMSFKKAIDLNPNYANAWKRLYEVYKIRGDKELAKKALRKYKKLMKSATTAD